MLFIIMSVIIHTIGIIIDLQNNELNFQPTTYFLSWHILFGSIVFDSAYPLFYTWAYSFFNHQRRPKIYYIAIICRVLALLISLGMYKTVWQLYSHWVIWGKPEWIIPPFVSFIIEYFIIHCMNLTKSEHNESKIKLRFDCFPKPNMAVVPFRDPNRLKKELRYSMNIVSFCMFMVLVTRVIVGILIGHKIGVMVYLFVMMTCSVVIVNVANFGEDKDIKKLKQIKLEYRTMMNMKLQIELQPTPNTLATCKNNEDDLGFEMNIDIDGNQRTNQIQRH